MSEARRKRRELTRLLNKKYPKWSDKYNEVKKSLIQGEKEPPETP